MCTVGNVEITEIMKTEGDPPRELVARRPQRNWIWVQASIVSTVMLMFVSAYPSNAQEKPLKIAYWRLGRATYRLGIVVKRIIGRVQTSPNRILNQTTCLASLNSSASSITSRSGPRTSESLADTLYSRFVPARHNN